MKMKKGVAMNPVEMLNRIACCLAGEKLMASQVAVLTAVARYPSITSFGIVHLTGISLQNVGRLLNHLTVEEDLTFVREQPKLMGKDYHSLPRHFYVTAQGMKAIRKILHRLNWGDKSQFLMVDVGKDGAEKDERIRERLNPVEMLNAVACCLTNERLMASQVAVLTTVAQFPSFTSCKIVEVTGISLQNTGRILNYLADVGDLAFIREGAKGKSYRSLPRHFYVTEQGMKTMEKLARHLHQGDMRGFRIVEVTENEDLFQL